MKLSAKSLLLVALSSLAVAANAVDITSLDGTQGAPGTPSINSTGWISYGGSGGGNASLANLPTGDADGSLRLQGDRIRAGVGVFEGYTGNGAGLPSFGTLGQLSLGTLFVDLYRSSMSQTNDPRYNIAVKLNFANGQGLTWENANNGGDLTQDMFVTRNIGSGNFFIRTANPTKTGFVNYDTPSDLHTLAEWAAGAKPAALAGDATVGFDVNSPILGINFSVGSGISSGPNSLIGGVDHLNVNFSGGNQYSYNFKAQPVPEPASMAALGLGALAMIRRRRNRA